MSKRGGRRRRNNGYLRNANYMQSIDLNERLFRYYRNVIVQMACSRFRWVNLPKTCDEWYLEMQLLLEGQATIAFPNKMRGTFMSLKVCGNGRPNMYGFPSSWAAMGDNGTKFNCNNMNGVIVYDNSTRYPIMDGIDLYARELAQLRMTKRTNRMHQMIPFILKGDQRHKQDMVNLFRNVADGEPAILATDGIEQIEYEALSTGVQYIGKELAEDESNVWNRIYSMLGISNTLFKSERQTDDEIHAQMSHTELVAASYIEERRKAAKKLNERFGEYLEAPIYVVMRRDNMSDNWNLAHNMQSTLELVK